MYFYMKVESELVGQIEGESLTNSMNAEGYMDLVGYTQEMGATFDATKFELTGKYKYEPITVTKRVDKASPVFFQHLSTNAAIKTVEIFCYRDTQGGKVKTEHFFTIRLNNVRIVDMKSALKTQDEGTRHASFLEDIKFGFEELELTDELNSKSHIYNVRQEIV